MNQRYDIINILTIIIEKFQINNIFTIILWNALTQKENKHIFYSLFISKKIDIIIFKIIILLLFISYI